MRSSKREKTGVVKGAESYTSLAYGHLKREILSGRIGAGGQIDAKAIADELGVSRTPVREAILRLASEGVVEVNARRGMRVLPLSVDEIQDIYQVVTALEVEAVFLMASLVDRAEAVRALDQAVAQMDAAIASSDGEEWNLADEQFHRAILDRCGNVRLAEAGRTHRDIAQRAHFVALRLVPLHQKARSADAHRELIAKISAGDAFNAREVHRGQRNRGAELLLTSLRTLRLDFL